MPDGNHMPRRFGSLFEGTYAYDTAVRRKRHAFGFLDQICQAIEPTETQKARAKTSYEAVGAWLAEDYLLVQALIYAQGSATIGTMIKPVGLNEFDVDLICRVAGYDRSLPPARLKAIIGDRLKAHGYYEKILEEKPRCWRLNYAGEFHLDITPSILNLGCPNGGELVPDRKLQAYKASNPIGYRKLFDRRAALQIMTQVTKAFDGQVRAEVSPFPEHGLRKGVLRRIVQLLKVHRDHYFLHGDATTAPLSIIITTLAMRAYELCVARYPYDNELDLVCDTIRMMPVFIEKVVVEGRGCFLVANETTAGENFAERWKDDARLSLAFNAWHGRALADFEAIAQAEGQDVLQKSLREAIGEAPVRKAADEMRDSFARARAAGVLGVSAGVGVSAAPMAHATPVKANTFFGRPLCAPR